MEVLVVGKSVSLKCEGPGFKTGQVFPPLSTNFTLSLWYLLTFPGAGTCGHTFPAINLSSFRFQTM